MNELADFVGWLARALDAAGAPYMIAGSVASTFQRQWVSFAGVDVWIASAEDTIVSKLEWSRASGGSERQLNDVRGILASKGAQLDRAYVETWVRVLGLQELWSRVTQP